MRAALAGTLLIVAVPAAADVWQGPIRIEQDADLDEAHGVVGGTGTAEDPFRIAGWAIEPGAAAAWIILANLTAAVAIEDVAIHGPGPGVGIRVRDVAHIVLRDVNISGVGGADIELTFGALLEDVDVAVLEHVTATDIDGTGVMFHGPGSITVVDSTFNDNTRSGLWIDGAASGSVTRVETSRNGFNGFYLCTSHDIVIVNSKFNGNYNGVDLTDATGHRFLANNMSDNRLSGLVLIRSPDTIVDANVFMHNGRYGIELHDSDVATDTNVFTGNRRGDVTPSDVPTPAGEVPTPPTQPIAADGALLAALAVALTVAAHTHRRR
jgi:parallel beta-helix repeat protein